MYDMRGSCDDYLLKAMYGDNKDKRTVKKRRVCCRVAYSVK